MPIIDNDNRETRAPKPTDSRLGKFVSGAWAPFDSVADANTRIVSAYRYKTLTVPILVSGVIKEYWYKEGILDGNLVEKVYPAGGAGGGTLFS